MIRRVNACVEARGGHSDYLLWVDVLMYIDGLLDIFLYGHFTLFSGQELAPKIYKSIFELFPGLYM